METEGKSSLWGKKISIPLELGKCYFLKMTQFRLTGDNTIFLKMIKPNLYVIRGKMQIYENAPSLMSSESGKKYNFLKLLKLGCNEKRGNFFVNALSPQCSKKFMKTH